jgi:Tol biopolymer transport system component
MHLSAGKRLGPYEILSSIGAGGMGEVYKARDTRLNRDVAIKILPASFASDEDRLRRFRQEAQSASALNHPNILTVYDVGMLDLEPYLVMELLEGESLAARLKKGKLSAAKTVIFARQIATGLAAAHAKGITHRDLKPENLFITHDGRLKILDFGLAKFVAAKPNEAAGGAATTTVTDAGTVMGTANYMSPEQAAGGVVDQRSDIFSFGCVLYEMLAGRRAFSGPTPVHVLHAVLNDDPVLPAGVPPGLQHLVRYCLEKDVEQRLQSPRDIVIALEAIAHTSAPSHLAALPSVRNPSRWLTVALAALALFACAWLAYMKFRPAPAVAIHRLTFRRGKIHAARFTPHGNGVVYSAQWEDEPDELFLGQFDNPGSRALGLSGAQLQGISVSEELALAEHMRVGASPFAPAGLLAQVPFSGGAAKPVEDKIAFADWSPDGKDLAVVRETDQGDQLEFPRGHVLYRTAGYISNPRVSSSGDRIAFIDHPVANDNAGSIAIVDRSGKKQTLAAGYLALEGLAWSAKKNEVWFTGALKGARYDIWAATLKGRVRLVYSAPVSLVLQDIAPDGRVLFTSEEQRTKLMFRGPADKRERELSWLDWSLLNNLSPDGKLVAFSESAEGAGGTPGVFLRETSGAPASFLGAGSFPVFSPDGQSVAAYDEKPPAILIYPVGPGQVKHIPMPGYTIGLAGLLPDGHTVWFNGNEPSRGPRYYLTNLQAAKPRPVTPEGTRPSSPGLVLNGKYLAGRSGGSTVLYPVGGGDPEFLKGVTDEDRIAGWSADGQAVFVYSRNDLPAKIYRVSRQTGKRELLREIMPADRAGMNFSVNTLQMTSDGKSYAYSFLQELSELQLAEGLR